MNHYIVVYLFLNSSFVLCLTKGGGDVGGPLGGGVTHGLLKSDSGSGVIDGITPSSSEELVGVYTCVSSTSVCEIFTPPAIRF